MKIILGSNSPRRKELLAEMGYSFEVRVNSFEEKIDKQLPIDRIPEDIALQKVKHLTPTQKKDECIICADTLVFLEGQVLGKPKSEREAKEMLMKLSGKTHTVITGVALSYQDKIQTFQVQTQVSFKSLSSAIIDEYIEKHSPLDKAGSYGIQDWIGLIDVQSIEGSYTNVVGLPTAQLHQELSKIKA